MAKSVAYVVRMRVGDDVADQRFAGSAVAACRRRRRAGSTRSARPISVLRIGASWALSSSIRAWMAGSGVTPMVHGWWKSAVV